MSRRPLGVTIALACAIVALAVGCGGGRAADKDAGQVGGLAGIGGPTGSGGAGTFVPTREVDLLFLIDDSPGMAQAQANLVRNVPQFVNAMQSVHGGLPDMHIAVVSSDLGTGSGSINGCTASGKAGAFQYAPRQPCTATTLEPGATFISHVGGVANYTGALEDVLSCIAPIGDAGCGFEHPLAAVARALGADGQPAPPENEGFLRPGAYLSIFILTNEDDCSAPPGSALFAASTPMLASTFGPPQDFRCNEFGHLCSGDRPPRSAPTGSAADSVTLDGCVPAETNGLLTPVATLVSQLRSLKRFPDEQIRVAAIAGPTAPYTVRWRAAATDDTGPWPEMGHSCAGEDGSFADPAVRIASFVNAFGAKGTDLSVCEQSFAPALGRLVAELPFPL